ncbi:MAG TPA: acyltransferase [Edaphobacter sp.]|nr:acyltransferase [Edaphobacter sp.]
MASTATTPLVKPARKPPLPALTGIRTLLAFNIVLFHFTPPYLGPVRPFVEHGFVFVNVFFLISGFILSYNYFDRGRNLVKRDFWMARFSRLYPIYLLVLLLSFPMLELEWHARSATEFWQGLVLTPLLLQGWSPSLATYWNTVAWTLSCEMAFYAAFPWLIRLPWPRKPSRLILTMLVLWVIDLLPAILYLHLNPDHLSGPVDRYTSTTFVRFLKYTPIPYAPTFLSGIALSRLQLNTKITEGQRMIIAALALLGLGLFFYFASEQVPYLMLHSGILLPLFSMLVFGLSGQHAISKIFSWGPLLLIGESSYCLYLLHFNAYVLIHNYHLPERLHIAAFDPWISYVALVGMSIFLYRFIENPLRRAILNRFPPSTRKVA